MNITPHVAQNTTKRRSAVDEQRASSQRSDNLKFRTEDQKT
jgi:hypothetical protein